MNFRRGEKLYESPHDLYSYTDKYDVLMHFEWMPDRNSGGIQDLLFNYLRHDLQPTKPAVLIALMCLGKKTTTTISNEKDI